MPQPPTNARELLDQLLSLSPPERFEFLQQCGSVESALAMFADEVERLAITRVARAVEAGGVIVKLADDIGQARPRARTRRARAQSLAYSGRFEEALPIYDEAISIAIDAGLKLEAAQARLAAIHALVHLARYEDAITAGEAARAAFVAADEPFLAGRADSSLGGVYQKLDDPPAALRHFERARPALRHDPIALAQLDSIFALYPNTQ